MVTFSPVDLAAFLLVAIRATLGVRHGVMRQLLALVGGAVGEFLGLMLVWGWLYRWIYGHTRMAAAVAWLGGDQGVVTALLTAVVVMGLNTLVLRSPPVARWVDGGALTTGVSEVGGALLGAACAIRQLFFVALLLGATSWSGHLWWQEAALRHWLEPAIQRLAAALRWEMAPDHGPPR